MIYVFIKIRIQLYAHTNEPCAFLRQVLYYLSLVARVVFVKVVEETDGERPSHGGGIVFARADWMANWINRLCTPAHALNRMKHSYYGSIPSYTRLVFFFIRTKFSHPPLSFRRSLSFFLCNRKVCFLPLFAYYKDNINIPRTGKKIKLLFFFSKNFTQKDFLFIYIK